MNGENTLLKRETIQNRSEGTEHLRVIAHEGEVVVGLIKKMHQRRGVQAEAGAEGQARQSRASAHTPSIADGTAEMHRGRGGSRHFQRHRGFFPEGSLFVSLRATGYLLNIFLFCLPLSVRQKKCRNEMTSTRREVYRKCEA